MGEIKKTGYEWSLEAKHRLINLSEYNLLTEDASQTEDDYFTKPCTKSEYLDAIEYASVKENSTPRKTEEYLEWRMYGLVPYNISSIQSGIQFGHAVVEYGQNVKGLGRLETNYNNWANKDKTFIVLNGGTTNENKDSKFYGTMQQHRDLFLDNDIVIAEFREPDLNDTLSAFVFLVDERVWNRELYPDYVNMPYPWNDKRGYKPTDRDYEKWEKENTKNREKWVEKIGNEKNVFLRDFLRQFRLAT
jgi:hypothetical protein